MDKLETVVKEARVKSPLAHFHITYLVSWKCPYCSQHCWSLIRARNATVFQRSESTACYISSSGQQLKKLLTFKSTSDLHIDQLFTTTLVKLKLMESNKNIDTSVQKSFMPGVPASMECHQQLLAIIGDGHKGHRPWESDGLILQNEYSSVHHQLITYCLQPPPVIPELCHNVYSDISAIITFKKWRTAPVPLKIGLSQHS